MVNPAPGLLPALLDPVLDYLSNNLPRPLYTLLVKLLSHSIAALSALFQLSNSLLTNAPEDWNAQNILPPIITILAAYLAISSFYRTTSWLLRISFWFMKWGALFGIFIGGVGYLLGNANGNGLENQGGILGLGGLFGTLLEDPRQRKSYQAASSRNKKPNAKRPKAWESFDHHNNRQHQEDANNQGNKHVEEIISQIVDTAGGLVGGAWWEALKTFARDAIAKPNEDGSTTRSRTSEKSKGKTRSR